MFKCKYKFELEDSIVSAKYVYKSQKRKQDKVIAILIPILMVAMIGMLIFDILSGNSYVWDIVLLVSLLVLEIMYLIIPTTLVASQKKSYYKQKLDTMDYLLVEIGENVCTEIMFKDGEENAKSVHGLRSLSSYLEDSNRLILVFNKVEYVCLRKENIEGGVDKLKAHLEKKMAKQSQTKK